jgi:hypothetical protein
VPTAASGLTFGTVTETSIAVSWTNGNCDKRLVVVKAGGAVGATPADLTAYTANAAFGGGGTIAADEYVVYADTGTSVTVTGLTGGTTYYFKIFSYNIGAGTDATSSAYLSTGAPTGNAKTLPSAPSAPDLTAGSDSGASSTDDITTVTTPTFAGTATGSNTVKLYADGIEVGSATASAGAWTITSSALSEGSHVMTATQNDGSNDSAASASLTITIDTTAPVTASVTAPANGGAYRASTVPAFGGSVADNSSGAGLAADGSTFTLKRDSDSQYWSGAGWGALTNLATTHPEQSGATPQSWSPAGAVTMPDWSAQSDGTYTVQATAADKAGNALIGAAITFTLDNTPPDAPALVSPDNGSTTTNTTPTFDWSDIVDPSPSSGLGSYELQIDDDSGFGSVNLNRTGLATSTYTLAGSEALAVGTWYWRARVLDAAGNAGAYSGSRSLTIESVSTAPTNLAVSNLSSSKPDFSARHNDPEGDAANKRRIQVGPTSADVTAETNLLWNESASGVSFSPSVAAGAQSQAFSYGGSTLNWNTTYSWRIRFWDTLGNASDWSDVSGFTTASPSAVLPNAIWNQVGVPSGTDVATSAVGGGLFYRWNEATGNYESTTTLQSGRGYFYYGTGTMTLTSGTTPPSSVSVGGLDYSASSPYPGWHMLGNPYNEPMNWQSTYDNGDTTNLESSYWKWDDTQYVSYNAATGMGPAGATIGPFQAFWVRTNSGMTGSATLRPASAYSKSYVPKPTSANAWLLQLSAVSGSLRDDYNWAGVNPDALDGRDPMDASNPGTINDPWINLHLEVLTGVSSPDELQFDVRPTPAEAGAVVTWTVVVQSSTTPMEVTLSWPTLEEMPVQWSFAIDGTDLRSIPSLTYTQTSSRQTFTLTATRLTASTPTSPEPEPPAADPADGGAASDEGGTVTETGGAESETGGTDPGTGGTDSDTQAGDPVSYPHSTRPCSASARTPAAGGSPLGAALLLLGAALLLKKSATVGR